MGLKNYCVIEILCTYITSEAYFSSVRGGGGEGGRI